MNRRFIGLLLISVFLSILLASNHEKNVTQSNKPNIILIYADDLGIGLLGHEGQKIIKTPHIDQLAREGIRFRRAYSNMLCAPARASLLTGFHDCHANGFQVTDGGTYTYANADESAYGKISRMIENALSPVPAGQVFLGEVAKRAGYITAQFGKLEWGFSTTDQQMKRHGWDHYFGYLDHVRAHGFYPPFLFQDGVLKEITGNTRMNSGKSGEPETEANFKERWNREGKEVYSQTIFMDSILHFIDAHKEQPFFLYFPTQLPHGPVSIPAVHPDFINDSRLTQIEKEYASMVKMLDDHVGQIVQKLQDLHIDDNTIVIFAADNGHEIYYSQAGRVLKPYTNMKTGQRFDDYKSKFYSDLGGDVFNGNGGRAGLKRSNHEGGIRVPLIIKWPQHIQKGRVSERLVANYDILPTLAEIVGFSGAFDTDGISFYKELLGQKGTREHSFIVYSSFVGPTLLTNDGWKIRSFLEKDAFELYHLPDDFREEKDLAEKYPERLKTLKIELLKACDGDFRNGLYSTSNQIPIATITDKK
ncbi:arylsulfatase [Salmonirosea aquatica]|uniref:Sulfatase-like hydrolase/transferase n=1 Tax=Salmonirosea aquatica TaxID=2654236 RepID=A0A7C9FPG0_9BACT|nr:sulfatase-like hydrolase/transferase [Cytophagaceae bacterium SJW1-29]